MRNITNAIRKRRLTNGNPSETAAATADMSHGGRDTATHGIGASADDGNRRSSSVCQQKSPTKSYFSESKPETTATKKVGQDIQSEQEDGGIGQPYAMDAADQGGWDVPPAGFFGGDSGLLKRVSSMPGNLSIFRAHLTNPLQNPEFHAAPQYTRRQAVQLAANEPDDTPVYGALLLGVTAAVFVVSMYALVVSKFMPYTGIAFLDAIKDDDYFCLLVPITGLSFNFAVFWNWLGMKYFRHN